MVSNYQQNIFINKIYFVILLSLKIIIEFLLFYFQMNFLSISALIMIIISIFMFWNIHKAWSFLPILRFTLEYVYLVEIIKECIEERNKSDNELFTVSNYLITFFHSFFLNFCFGMKNIQSIICFVLEGLALFGFGGDEEVFILKRLFKNILTLNFAKYFTILISMILIQIKFSKRSHKKWKNYIFFKSNYYTINEIFDNIINPVIALKKQGFQIQYINQAGQDFLKKYSNKTETSSDSFQLKNIVNFHILENQISKCLSLQKTCFDFLLTPVSELPKLKKENSLSSLSKMIWVKMYINQSKIEENDLVILEVAKHSHYSNIYETEIMQFVNDQLNTICENIEKICEKAPPLNTIKDVNINNSQPYKNVRVSPIPSFTKIPSPILNNRVQSGEGFTISKKNFNELTSNKETSSKMDYLNKILGKKQRTISDNEFEDSKDKQIFISPVLFSKTRNGPNKISAEISNNMNSDSNQKREKKEQLIRYLGVGNENIYNTYFESPLLFQFRNDMNYIYDVYLSLEVFFSFKNGKYLDDLEIVNLDHFFSYYIEYIRPIALARGFEINYISHRAFNEKVEVHYIYLRALLFNVMLFIFENIEKEKGEKKLGFTVDPNSYGNNMIYHQMNFSFIDDFSDFDYKKISNLLGEIKNLEIIDMEINKIQKIGLRLLLSNFICKNVFSEIELPNYFTIEKQSNKLVIISGIFGISRKFDEKKGEKIFFNISSDFSRNAEDILVNKIGRKKRKFEQKKNDFYEFIQNDVFNEKNEKNISVNKDKISYENFKQKNSQVEPTYISFKEKDEFINNNKLEKIKFIKNLPKELYNFEFDLIDCENNEDLHLNL